MLPTSLLPQKNIRYLCKHGLGLGGLLLALLVAFTSLRSAGSGSHDNTKSSDAAGNHVRREQKNTLSPGQFVGKVAFAYQLAASAAGTKHIWVRFAYMFVPLGLAMHLAHNFSHILFEGKSILAATQGSLNRYTPWTLGEPVWKISPLVSPDVVSFLQLFFVLGD